MIYFVQDILLDGIRSYFYNQYLSVLYYTTAKVYQRYAYIIPPTYFMINNS